MEIVAIQEISEKMREQGVTIPQGAAIHLAVFSEPYLAHMYAGRKTMESRISKNCVAPYGRISEGDVVVVKRAAGPIEAIFSVGKVCFFDMYKDSMDRIKEKYSEELCTDEDFWQQKGECRYATVIEIRNLARVKPFRIEKKDRRAWIALE